MLVPRYFSSAVEMGLILPAGMVLFGKGCLPEAVGISGCRIIDGDRSPEAAVVKPWKLPPAMAAVGTTA